MAKWYIQASELEDEEITFHTLSHHLDIMRSDGEAHRVLYAGVPMRGTGDFYCVEHGFHGKRGDDHHDCGRLCDAYEPRNGKNGRCRWSRDVYEPDTSKAFLLKPDGTLSELDPKSIMTRVLLTPALKVRKVIEAVDKDTRPLIEQLEEFVDMLPDVDPER
jgi:hypothetical protein